MTTFRTVLIVMLATASGATQAEQLRLDRLPLDELDVRPPSLRVEGTPGTMHVVDRSCRDFDDAGLRRRIVNIAIQEWAFFGFTVLDQTDLPESPAPRSDRPWRPRTWLDQDESARVASSIAGYWAITPDGSWILERQNEVWTGSQGVAARWRDPWSAAFISWVMCEAGLGDSRRFRRAIAHHAYIDQAIMARDSGDRDAAFVAYEIGERPIEPGDLLCVARRPAYSSVDERRAQLGTGIRSHCDIVVKVDTANERILAIGGNVRGSVRLKLHAADFIDATGNVRQVGRGRRTVFAHLKLGAEAIGADAFETNPTILALADESATISLLRERLRDDTAFRY